MRSCYDCGTDVADNRFRCDNCYNQQVTESKEKKRRPLTEWEKQKLSFHRDENYWEQSIRTRHLKKGRDGKKYPAFVNKRGKVVRLHEQPKRLWPKPKGKR